jgi:peptide/nickel transport system substrate-binding protein
MNRPSGRILFLALALCAARLVGAGTTNVPPASAQTQASSSAFSEAPSLTALVAQKKLPPLEQRLPRNPMLVQPVEKPGDYGGTFDVALTSETDASWLDRTLGVDSLSGWDASWMDAEPRIAESIKVSHDAREYLFQMRQGMRWSDGEPFNADDVVFWHRNVFLRFQDIFRWQMPWLFADGKPVDVESQGGTNLVFRFATPQALFLRQLAGPLGDEPVRYPRHYLARYIEMKNFPATPTLSDRFWLSFFFSTNQWRGNLARNRWMDPELPTLNAWQVTASFGYTNLLTARRNPFYWKVDTTGCQLPYIDQVVYRRVDDDAQMLLAACRGGFDLAGRDVVTWSNLARIESALKTNGCRLVPAGLEHGNTAVIHFNQNHPEDVKRAIFQNKEFRIGLSLAIDRRRIIREVFAGRGDPSQPAPPTNSPLHHAKLAGQFLTYNPDAANKSLDKAGLSTRDATGRRVGSDGRPLILVVDVLDSDHAAVMRIVAENWRAVGIDARIRKLDATTFHDANTRLRQDCSVWWGAGGAHAWLELRDYVPTSADCPFAPAWGRWFCNPSDPQAVEPPDPVKKQMETCRRIFAAPNDGERTSLMGSVLDAACDQFHVIGISREPPSLLLLRTALKNTPQQFLQTGFDGMNPAPASPCQFYLQRTNSLEP